MGAYHEKLYQRPFYGVHRLDQTDFLRGKQREIYQRPFYEVQAVKGLRETLSTTFLRGASSKRT